MIDIDWPAPADHLCEPRPIAVTAPLIETAQIAEIDSGKTGGAKR